MSSATLTRALRSELQPHRLIPSLVAGTIVGVISVTYALSFSFLVFSGDLSEYLPQYLSFALFSSAAVGLMVGIFSSGAFSGIVQDAPAAICGLNAAAIAAALPAEVSSQTKFLTVIVAIGFTAILTGAASWLLGQLNLGSLLRFIPYPVVGGFLVGTGWLLFAGSFSITADIALSFQNLAQLFQGDRLPLWGTGFAYAAVMTAISRRWSHWALLPSSILISVSLFYLCLLFTQTSIDTATELGWLIDVPDTVEAWRPLAPQTFFQVDWSVIIPRLGGILTALLLTVIAVLLSSSGLEVAIKRDVELNQELKAVGMANIVTGLGGGLIGYHGVSTSLLMYKIGARSRLAPLVAGSISVFALLAGPAAVALMPKFLLGGLVGFLGLSLLAEWLYDAWFKLSKLDYFNVVVILGVIVVAGFLQGVAYGIIVAVILFVINYSRIPVARHTLTGESYTSRVRRLPSQERILRKHGQQIHILQLQGLLFFGTASRLLTEVRDRLDDPNLKPLKFVILDFRLVSGLDSSVIVNFQKLKQIAEQTAIGLVFTNLSPHNKQQLEQGEVLVEGDSLCYVFPDLDQGVAWCEDQLLRLSKLRRSRSMPLFMQLKARFPEPDLVPILMQTYLVPMQLDEQESLFQKGDACDGLYFLETGQISLLDTDEQGQSRRIATYVRGTPIGERGLYQKSTYLFTAVADRKSSLFFLPTGALERMEERHPQLASALHRFTVRLLAERLEHREREIQELLK